MKPQITAHSFAGVHNKDLRASGSRIIQGATWRKQRVVLVIPADYPRIDEVHEVVRRIGGHLVEALRLAKESGSPRAANVVMVGAASVYLPLAVAAFEAAVTQAFAAKGERVIGINLAAFRAGRTILTPASS